MVQRRGEPVLVEILAAIDDIVAATKGKTIDDFSNEWLLRHGVERGIEIISEAARHLPESYAARTSEIPWKEIRGIGNVLRHEYHKSSDAIVWAVVTNHLPLPRSAVCA
ncbi:MAG: HepT-like ribonuclease domain-containing protein [Mesorhizobium sp.]